MVSPCCRWDALTVSFKYFLSSNDCQHFALAGGPYPLGPSRPTGAGRRGARQVAPRAPPAAPPAAVRYRRWWPRRPRGSRFILHDCRGNNSRIWSLHDSAVASPGGAVAAGDGPVDEPSPRRDRPAKDRQPGGCRTSTRGGGRPAGRDWVGDGEQQQRRRASAVTVSGSLIPG
jgi:hypothetical protein